MLASRSSQTPAISPKLWLLPLAFVVSLVYLLLLPPWQQNDEPVQFEYVWLAANLDHWPLPGDVDAKLRRDVMASMIEHRFYRNNKKPVNMALLPDPVNIGVSQLDGMPLYYFLASIPLSLFHNADITQQLYLARLVSLSFFVATVFFAIQITNLLFGTHLIGWMIAAFIALLPQLAYRMMAVNDDASAVASMTFFIWMSVRGIKCGPDWKSLIGIPFSAALCFLSKPTAWMAVPFSIVALLLTIFHTRPRFVWAGLFSLMVIGVLGSFEWRATLPAEFYQFNGITRRVQPQRVVDGEYSFMIDRKHTGFYQVLDKQKLTEQSAVTDRMVTVGVWVWANKPIESRFLQLQFSGKNVLKLRPVAVSEQPVFISEQAQIPEDYRAPVLRIVDNTLPVGVELYFDCFILVPGEQDVQSLPRTRKHCSQVQWGDYNGQNLVRNPSSEEGWFPLRGKVAAFVSRFYDHQVTDLWAVFDPTTSFAYFRKAPEYLFRTFWGRFNWGTLPLVGSKPYRFFAVLSVLAMVGVIIAFWRYRKMADWTQVLFLLLLMVVDLFYTLFRFTGNWNNYYNFLPQARYFFPVIAPVAFFICLGWYALLAAPLKWSHLKDKFIYIFIGLLILYNGWAWYTIWAYWYR